MLQTGQILDGYLLLRPIGAGGFGQVWLCQSEALRDFRALKFIAATGFGHLEREFDSLCRYRAAAGQLRSPFILPIEHVNRTQEGLFYIMPLGDGVGASDPACADWQPMTLTARIEARRSAGTWFSMEEIRDWVSSLLQALQLLSETGLVHRDVKPDNIIFLNGRPCLGDISLLGEDGSFLTRKGTPGYAAPSWYLESGGHPDMYGAAMTLYSLLTGNPPDKAGRVAFRWPPQGEHSLSPAARKDWLRAHRLIARAVDDRVGERFLNFTQFERALANDNTGKKPLLPAWFAFNRNELNIPRWIKWAAAFLIFCVMLFALQFPAIQELAQRQVEDFIFPKSHPLSRHSRDCNLKLGEFRGDVASESLIVSIDPFFFRDTLRDMESELRSLPKLAAAAVPAKVAAIREKLLSGLETEARGTGEKLVEFKKTAELLAKECGEEEVKDTRESIQRMERDMLEMEHRHSEQIKALVSQIEKLMEEERWNILADVLEVVKKLTP